MKQSCSCVVWQEGKWFVAQCLDVDIASQARTRSSALRNLKEALALHLQAPTATLRPELRG